MTDRIYLRPPAQTDREPLVSLAKCSTTLHGEWVSPPTDASAFEQYLQRQQEANYESRVVCLRATKEIVGVINVSEIVRGAFRSGYLSYWVFSPFERHGYLREGLNAMLREMFQSLELHRLEANIQPDNHASIALVKRCGFRKEGYSPRYLRIGGRWRDHERWALTVEDWQSLLEPRSEKQTL